MPERKGVFDRTRQRSPTGVRLQIDEEQLPRPLLGNHLCHSDETAIGRQRGRRLYGGRADILDNRARTIAPAQLLASGPHIEDGHMARGGAELKVTHVHFTADFVHGDPDPTS